MTLKVDDGVTVMPVATTAAVQVEGNVEGTRNPGSGWEENHTHAGWGCLRSGSELQSLSPVAQAPKEESTQKVMDLGSP